MAPNLANAPAEIATARNGMNWGPLGEPREKPRGSLFRGLGILLKVDRLTSVFDNRIGNSLVIRILDIDLHGLEADDLRGRLIRQALKKRRSCQIIRGVLSIQKVDGVSRFSAVNNLKVRVAGAGIYFLLTAAHHDG